MKGGKSGNMDEKPGTLKILTWLGVAALVALPVVVFLSKRRSHEVVQDSSDDSSNIFALELEE